MRRWFKKGLDTASSIMFVMTYGFGTTLMSSISFTNDISSRESDSKMVKRIESVTKKGLFQVRE
ncbi:hypothetical protein MGWOODY_Mmi1088 [hydrothermal vent metagenome]|uniref:Uncharacterized protein n=1 Tax=hydrothermal vent metagenome TaxID=652676 RepID=A0A160VHK0_9ZZZZ